MDQITAVMKDHLEHMFYQTMKTSTYVDAILFIVVEE